jgi:hypothetical protein
VAVLGDQLGDRGGAEQRGVAGEHEHVHVVIEVVVRQAGEADGEGVAGAALDGLLHELEPETGAVLGELLGDALRAVAHHDDRTVDLGRRQGVQDVEHHGAPTEQVQRLGSGRAHARSLAGGQDHGGQVTLAHGNRSTAPGVLRCARFDIESAAMRRAAARAAGDWR